MMNTTGNRSAELPLPDFYVPENAERWAYRPDAALLLRRAAVWRERFRLRAAAEDSVRVRLLLVDVQKDFCFPEGALYVGGRSGRGALEDNRRTAEFIYRHLGRLTEIACTLDTHLPYQIFFPSFWLTEEGEPPEAHREVRLEDVRGGRLRPNPALAAWLTEGDHEWLKRQAEFYCGELERAGKYTLYLWPPHCLLGSEGHALVGVLQEARLFHAFARLSPDLMRVKGEEPLTEHYSALRPELMRAHDGGPIAKPSAAFTERLLDSDVLIVAGQAASHCVRHTLEDLLKEVRARGPGRSPRVYILVDCMSSVAVPDPSEPGRFVADFTPQTEEALKRFSEAGMRPVRSTDPLGEWPEFPLP
ncbi:MAG: nicotinamidase [Gemmatimonadota bacterium]